MSTRKNEPGLVTVSFLAMQVLRDVAAGLGTHRDCRGMSEHGGRQAVVMSLMRKGLLAWKTLRPTRQGREFLKLARPRAADWVLAVNKLTRRRGRAGPPACR